MKLLRSINAQSKTLVRSIGRRYCSAEAVQTPVTARSEEYLRRNYADNVAEYNTVVNSLTAQRRYYLLRDVYEDMKLDGVQPTRDTFHSLIAGTMKGSRLQDAFFFKDEMRTMGLVPDVALYNLLMSICGKCQNSEQAVRVLEEMRRNEVKPTGSTYICLLHACAATGRTDQVYAIVRDMTAAGLGLNRFCYAGLIAAHKNQKPVADDIASKVIELVEQSRGWSSPEQVGGTAENFMMGVSLEELYNIPTAEYIFRRGLFVDKRLTVYHAAFHAFADLRNVEGMETLQRMLEAENKSTDTFITLQMMRCYLHSGDIDSGHKVFEDYIKSGRPAVIDLYMTFVEGAMVGYTPKGMKLAQETLVDMISNDSFPGPKYCSDLLLIAAGEKSGGYETANYLWDLMLTRKFVPSPPAVEAYYTGLKARQISDDDPRLRQVTEILNRTRRPT